MPIVIFNNITCETTEKDETIIIDNNTSIDEIINIYIKYDIKHYTILVYNLNIYDLLYFSAGTGKVKNIFLYLICMERYDDVIYFLENSPIDINLDVYVTEYQDKFLSTYRKIYEVLLRHPRYTIEYSFLFFIAVSNGDVECCDILIKNNLVNEKYINTQYIYINNNVTLEKVLTLIEKKYMNYISIKAYLILHYNNYADLTKILKILDYDFYCSSFAFDLFVYLFNCYDLNEKIEILQVMIDKGFDVQQHVQLDKSQTKMLNFLNLNNLNTSEIIVALTIKKLF